MISRNHDAASDKAVADAQGLFTIQKSDRYPDTNNPLLHTNAHVPQLVTIQQHIRSFNARITMANVCLSTRVAACSHMNSPNLRSPLVPMLAATHAPQELPPYQLATIKLPEHVVYQVHRTTIHNHKLQVQDDSASHRAARAPPPLFWSTWADQSTTGKALHTPSSSGLIDACFQFNARLAARHQLQDVVVQGSVPVRCRAVVRQARHSVWKPMHACLGTLADWNKIAC